jgi:DNA polymerase elongation subunit (family B)
MEDISNIETQKEQKKSLEAISIYDWTYFPVPDENRTFILAWGLNQNSKPTVIRIEDYFFSCYLELPEKIHPIKVTEVSEWIRKVLKEDAPIQITFEQKRKLYYYQGEKTYPMLKLDFPTKNAMDHLKNIMKKEWNTPVGKRSFPIYEDKISVIRKLLTEKNLLYSGWITGVNDGDFELVDFDEKISTLDNEYRCSYKNIRQPLMEELDVKTTYPTIFSWDIECYSSNPKAMPKKTNASDVIYAVSCIYSRMGDKERQRYLIAVGEDLTVQNAILIQVKDEYELLTELRNLIRKLDPDMLIGYNIFGFDIPYTDFRIQRYMENWTQLGRIKGQSTSVKKISWESSAFGHNDFFQFLGMDGRICLDLLPIVKRDYKLLRYDLDFVSNNFLGKGKFPVKPKEMFAYTKEYNEALLTKNENPERYQNALLNYNKILDYCVQDSDLVLDLMEKLSMWIGLIELSNIVGVSIVDIFTRGQQIRCLSQIYDLATRENIVLDQNKNKENIPFAGGFVQEPIPGLYDNVICLDFASLYPSIIMAFNICYTTLLEPETVMDDEKVNHFHIDMDASEVDDGDEEGSALDDNEEEKKDGKRIKAHYRYVKKDVYEGVLPRLVYKLVNERRLVRKMLEGNKDPVLKIILDKRQLALKVSANSVFGFLGVANGKLPLMCGAISITSKGRELIGYVNKYLEEKYNGKIVYNDSVSGDTPILIREKEGNERWIRICELFKFDNKEQIFIDAKERFLIEGIEIWSDKGWTKIKQAIKHKTNKQMYRVLTHTGCVDVTEDHSLFLSDNTKISPKDCQVGTKLLHKDLPDIKILYHNITKEQSTLWGFFYAEGSCGRYECKSGVKNSWAISGKDLNLLEKYKSYLELIHPDYKFKILDTLESSNAYKLVPCGNIVKIVAEYRQRFYDNNKHKKVPFEILHSDKETIQHFLDGYQEGDGLQKRKSLQFANKGEIGSAGLFHLYKLIGKCISINSNLYKKDCFWFQAGDKYFRDTDKIKKILPLGECQDYVYDIETENHHFGAGIGRLIVSNTDSSMVDLGIKDSKLCNEWGNRLADEISKLFPPPLRLEYEKGMSLLCLKKKKYAAFLIDKNGNIKKNKKDILVRGIILARRDTLPWLQNKYSDLLYNILCRQPMMSSLKMIYGAVEDMMLLKLDLKGILIVRQLSAFYKNENYFMSVFSKRLKSLGHLVTAGDRLEYLIIKNPQEKLLGNRMVTYEMFLDGSYELDVLYYLDHNLKNAIDQLFSIGHMQELNTFQDIGFQTKRKFVSVKTPIAMMVEAFKNGVTLEEVKEFLSIE